MKKVFIVFLATVTCQLCVVNLIAQSVAINGDGLTAHPSAILDVKSTTKGMLVPRMTSAERTGILDPAMGLLVYDNETASFWFYKAAGWTELISGGGSGTNYWNTNGTHIYNNNTGNVGIGIDNPLEKFTVQTLNNSYGISHRGEGGNVLSTRIGGTSAGIGTFSPTNMRIFSNGLSRILIAEATGNVGIGTDDPLEKLTVQTLNNSYGISHRGEGGNVLSTRIGGTSAGIGTFSATNMRIFANGLSRMLIAEATGYVGIGTDNPTEQLTVQTLNNSYGISHRGEGGNVLATRIGGTSAGIGTFSPTNMRIFANGASVMLFAEATGNVGIGTDNPTQKLSVNGTVRSKEVIVEAINWPDYVFHNKYKLPSLNDLEKFIQQNKHLPNIPSAKEVEEKGLHLGDTQKRMMEKIEELTLYIIQLNKRIEELEKK